MTRLSYVLVPAFITCRSVTPLLSFTGCSVCSQSVSAKVLGRHRESDFHRSPARATSKYDGKVRLYGTRSSLRSLALGAFIPLLTPSPPPVIAKHARERIGRPRLGLSPTERS